MTARRIKFDIRTAGKPIVILLLVWLVLSLGFYFGWTRPKVRAASALGGADDPQGIALGERRAEVEQHEAFLAALKKAEGDLVYLRREVLSTRELRLVDVQQELATLCGQFNIDIDSVAFANELLPDEELDRMAMVVPLEGGYESLRRFLLAVENSSKFLLVERVALGEGKDGGSRLKLDITLTTYFDLPPEMKGKRSRGGRRKGKA
jgi:Tfp pilus assembly protein PilO